MTQPHQPATDRLAEKRSHLRYLEKVAARYARLDRFDILLEIDGLQREIAVLEQTIQAASADSKSSADTLASRILQKRFSSAERQALLERVAENLTAVEKALKLVASELEYLPGTAQIAARRLIDQAQADIDRLGNDWRKVRADRAVPEQVLRALLHEIWQTQAAIHPLELREIHRRGYSVMERQRAGQQLMLPVGDLRRSLELSIATEQSAIAEIEQKAHITSHDAEMLDLHRENLTWYQEMVEGKRPYTTVGLLRLLRYEEESMENIDAFLAGN